MSTFPTFWRSLVERSTSRKMTARGLAIASRFGDHFQQALSAHPVGVATFKSEACRSAREAFARTATEFARAMEECDGSPTAVTRLAHAGGAYMQAYAEAATLVAEVAEQR